MKPLITFLLLLICLTAISQPPPVRNWVDTEVTFTDSAGNRVRMQNSLPKGGGNYTDASGKIYSYVIFWTRVVNESDTPLALLINFPATPFTIFPSHNSFIKIFLPPDTMTPEKVWLGDYGLTNLPCFLDTALNKPGMLQKVINPKEEWYFYVPVLIQQAQGTARAAFELKAQDLFFNIRIDPYAAHIPCGHLGFKH